MGTAELKERAETLADKILDCNGDAAKIGELIDEAAKRPEKLGPRPYHKTHKAQLGKDGK